MSESVLDISDICVIHYNYMIEGSIAERSVDRSCVAGL
jgi:hypothetical protein